ncbi:MAG TPA: LuxR C-terminal-related transcriptional regulator, partial [Clostridia bacterium]|nr:LuxR C-terminal-related transcriptional regulator [Clostridia bacterium]
MLHVRGYGEDLLYQLSLLFQNLKKASTSGIPMAIRLFLFLVLLVFTMFLGVVAILLVSGTFTAGLAQSEQLIQNDLTYLSNGINDQLGLLSLHTVELSKSLSTNMEAHLTKQGQDISQIKDHPELLEDLLLNEFDRALFSLLRSKSSGVFIILNGTVNPRLPNAETSKAGLYIKNMEPNIINSSSPNITILRGFSSTGRRNSLPLHPQWGMEFDIEDAPYYNIPLHTAANNSKLSLSKLYYWTPPLIIPGTSEEVMLCSVPLIDSNGDTFGVCGFEISAMLFKLSHMPKNTLYNRAFCLLFSPSNGIINTRESMISGNYSARNSSKDTTSLRMIKNKKSFYSYEQNDGNSFLGFHTLINLYPEDSPFQKEEWMAAIMVPKYDVVRSISRLNILLSSLLILLLIIGITVSYLLSQNYIRPISLAFDSIKSTELAHSTRTRIPEINDLIDFLAHHDEKLHQKAKEQQMPIPILTEFMKNSKSLSPAERAVFNLYVQGHTAQEIASILFLSINTIKTHNKRIYMKLNVGSRQELLLYINMLK